VNHHPKNMTADELRQGMRWLTKHLYNDQCTEQRRAPFFQRFANRRHANHACG
jgi:hypothetical protein